MGPTRSNYRHAKQLTCHEIMRWAETHAYKIQDIVLMYIYNGIHRSRIDMWWFDWIARDRATYYIGAFWILCLQLLLCCCNTTHMMFFLPNIFLWANFDTHLCAQWFFRTQFYVENGGNDFAFIMMDFAWKLMITTFKQIFQPSNISRTLVAIKLLITQM